jgi:MerR family copper efflux transcriptional regulator
VEHGLLIGEVAVQSGLSRKALRLYEARGILPPSRRTPSGYRCYPVEVLGLLAFVAQARRLGLTLAEIEQIVALRRSGSAPCVHVRTLLEQRAADLEGMLVGVRGILDAWRSTKGRHAARVRIVRARSASATASISHHQSATNASARAVMYLR